MTEYVLGLTAALAVLCTVGGYAVLQQRRRFDARLQTYLVGRASVDFEEIPTRPRPPRRVIGITQLQLTQAGVAMSNRTFLVIQLGLAAVGSGIAWLFGPSLGVWLLPVMIGAFAIGVVLPRVVVRFKRNRRLAKFESQFANALDSLATAAEVGLSIPQAMETISRDMPAPLGLEFGHVLRTLGMGLSLPEALDQLADRVPSRDVELFAAALGIQYRTGGNLSQILHKIADTVRQRINMRSEIKALTAQQRYSAYLMAALPIFLVTALRFVSPAYFAQIVQPGTMRIILVAAGAGIVVGLFFMLRIADVEV